MTRHLAAVIACGLSVCFSYCLGEEPMQKLPKPHYQHKDTDPDWLAYAAQFHGHLGPWATAGARAGMAGRAAVGADGYFDLEVTCEGPFQAPPRSCLLDGLQVTTGCTLGKRNLHWVEAEEVLVRMKNTRSGKQVEIRPTATLLELLTSFKPRPKAQTADKGEDHDHDHDHDHEHADAHREDPLEAIARKIARLPENEILSVKTVGE